MFEDTFVWRNYNCRKQLELIKQVGINPYEYIGSLTKLPGKKDFYKQGHIKQNDYELALEVWNEFLMKNMRYYHDLHLKTDSLLLADVFGEFRNIFLEYYGLDPSHYFSSPGCTFQYRFSEFQVKFFEKYLWWSAIFSKSTCNSFLFLLTGMEELYFITSLYWTTHLWNISRKPLLCSEKLGKILGRHPE